MPAAESEWPEFQGNPAFAAPEALRNGRTGKHYSTALADAYSVGVTLFQLLTGQLPVRAMCASADKSGGDESRRWKRRLRRWEHALLEKVNHPNPAYPTVFVPGEHQLGAPTGIWRCWSIAG